MPTVLIAKNQQTPATKHWIEERVVRVGRGGDCDFCVDVDGVTETAFLLEFREGRYFAINHSGGDLRVGEQRVGNMQSCELRAGQVLQVGQTRFRLKTEGSADPCPRPFRSTEHDSAYLDGVPAVDPVQTGSTSQWLCWSVLAVTAVGFVVLLKRDSTPKVDTASNFASVIAALIREDGHQKSPEVGHVRRLLQQARTAELRGNRQTAFRSYAFVRDMLMRSDANLAGISAPLKKSALLFIKRRLSRLQ